MTISRRYFLSAAGAATSLVSASAISGRVQAAGIPEAATMSDATTQPPLFPDTGPDYQPVATLNGWTAPWRMNGDWKEFHLVAEPVVREIAPGMVAHLWGYNGQSPGPTIEAVEGDKLRLFVTNKLPEHTTIHWHGQLLPYRNRRPGDIERAYSETLFCGQRNTLDTPGSDEPEIHCPDTSLSANRPRWSGRNYPSNRR